MSQLLQFKTGASTNSSLTPDHFWNGIAMEADGSLAVDDTAAIDHHMQGLPVTKEGRLAVEFAAPIRFNNGAMPLTVLGRLAVIAGPPRDAFLAANGYRLTGELVLD